MSEILTFLFGDEITHAQKQTIIDAAAVEDLRHGESIEDLRFVLDCIEVNVRGSLPARIRTLN